jgi:hypothetical protein
MIEDSIENLEWLLVRQPIDCDLERVKSMLRTLRRYAMATEYAFCKSLTRNACFSSHF